MSTHPHTGECMHIYRTTLANAIFMFVLWAAEDFVIKSTAAVGERAHKTFMTSIKNTKCDH